MGEWEGRSTFYGANQSKDLTLLILPSSLRAVIFTYDIVIHFRRCQAAGLLLPPDEGDVEPG